MKDNGKTVLCPRTCLSVGLCVRVSATSHTPTHACTDNNQNLRESLNLLVFQNEKKTRHQASFLVEGSSERGCRTGVHRNSECRYSSFPQR